MFEEEYGVGHACQYKALKYLYGSDTCTCRGQVSRICCTYLDTSLAPKSSKELADHLTRARHAATEVLYTHSTAKHMATCIFYST
jgi:hypothetical protein